jgi:hypothetical protein
MHIKKGSGVVFAIILLLSLMSVPYIGGKAHAERGGAMERANIRPSGVDGWNLSEKPAEYTPASAYTYMNGAAELFLAYNMKKLTVQRYEKAKRPAVILEVYAMGSPEDAYGLFSFESDDPGAGIGQGSEFGGGLLRFWKGSYFVSVYGDGAGGDVEAATLKLGRTVADAITETGNPPRILSLLPARTGAFTRNQTWFVRSHILLNQRFFIAHKNILDLSGDVEAALGRYGAGNDRMHLLLVRYPGRARADKAFDSFRKAYMPDVKGGSSVKTENGKWTVAAQSDAFIAVAFDAPDEAHGRKMIDAAIALRAEEKR